MIKYIDFVCFSSLSWEHFFMSEELFFLYLVLGKGLVLFCLTFFIVLFLTLFSMVVYSPYLSGGLFMIFIFKYIIKSISVKLINEVFFFKFFSFLYPMMNMLFFEIEGNMELPNKYKDNINKGMIFTIFVIKANQWYWDIYFVCVFDVVYNFYFGFGVEEFVIVINFFNEYLLPITYLGLNNVFGNTYLLSLCGNVLLYSLDVMHSLFCLDFGFKVDVVPGSLNSFIFSVDYCFLDKLSKFNCAEFCGINHSYMGFDMVICTDFEFCLEYLFESFPLEEGVHPFKKLSLQQLIKKQSFSGNIPHFQLMMKGSNKSIFYGRYYLVLVYSDAFFKGGGCVFNNSDYLFFFNKNSFKMHSYSEGFMFDFFYVWYNFDSFEVKDKIDYFFINKVDEAIYGEVAEINPLDFFFSYKKMSKMEAWEERKFFTTSPFSLNYY